MQGSRGSDRGIRRTLQLYVVAKRPRPGASAGSGGLEEVGGDGGVWNSGTSRGMGPAAPVRGGALRGGAGAEQSIPTICHRALEVPGLCHQPEQDKRTICREYDGRATAENYIKEGCNDAGFGVLSGQNFKANQNYLQMAILAYNSTAGFS